MGIMKITALKAGSVLLLGLAVAMGGCSKDAKTPKEAVINLAKAIEKNDKSLFLATVNIKDEDKDAAGQLFDAMITAIDFQKSLEKTYGKDALKSVGSGPADDVPAADKVEKGTVKEDGDKAKVTPADSKTGIDTIKINGIWKVKFDDIGAGDTKAQNIKMAQAMKKAIDATKGDIGKPGMTAEKLLANMQKAMKDNMMAK